MASITLSGWFKCIKYSMFAFCLLAWIIGVITLIVGIIVRVNGSLGPLDYEIPMHAGAHEVIKWAFITLSFLPIFTGAHLLIAVGFFVMIMGFLGCCGTIRESQCLLISFFLSVFFCFTLLMAAGLWAIAWSSKLDDYLYNYLEKHVANYRIEDEQNESTKTMDYLQNQLSCCGVLSVADYGEKPVPKSCGTSVGVYSTAPGCHRIIVTSVQGNMSTICGIGISFAILLILGMVCSMMLCCALREIS